MEDKEKKEKKEEQCESVEESVEEKQTKPCKQLKKTNFAFVDCKYREKNRCTKLGKGVAIDCRGDVRCCWERMFCDFFERR